MFLNTMYTIIVMVSFSATVKFNDKNTTVSNITFKWVEFDKKFDCIAAISVNGTPISTGVFISELHLLTSANPLQAYIQNSTSEITIHTVSKVFNTSKTRKAESLAGNQSFRHQYWVTIGYDEFTHTTIHDILIITMPKSDSIKENKEDLGTRRPFNISLPYANRTFLPPGGAVFAGFGFIDDIHVSNNTELEVAYYEDSTFADCDEWIPREWGRFICLLNEENLVGLASGMPLFHSSNMTTVIGIGCFALQKGDESVLIFTDLRPYVNHLYGYLEPNATYRY